MKIPTRPNITAARGASQVYGTRDMPLLVLNLVSRIRKQDVISAAKRGDGLRTQDRGAGRKGGFGAFRGCSILLQRQRVWAQLIQVPAAGN